MARLVVLCLCILSLAVSGFCEVYSYTKDGNCTLCVSFAPTDGFVIRDDNNYHYDCNEFHQLLESLCTKLGEHSFDFSVEKCLNGVRRYTYGLYSQSNPHVYSFTAQQICAKVSACTSNCCSGLQPEQVHISMTTNPTEMVVMWVASEDLKDSRFKVEYFTEEDVDLMEVEAARSTYVDGGWIGNIYTATMTSLKPLSYYTYRIVTNFNEKTISSNEFQFYSPPPNNMTTSDTQNIKFVPRKLKNIANPTLFNIPLKKNEVYTPVIAHYGDMDTSDNANETASMLTQFAESYSVNMVLHNGDIAYADTDEGVWDVYFRMVEGYASRIPFMTVPGNHEIYYDFSAYNSRLTMPIAQSGSTNKQYYSFNYHNIHFITWSFEQSFGLDLFPGKDQYNWIIDDLTEANKNRDQQPWIVMVGHRPLYCSTTSDNCVQAIYIRHLLEDIIKSFHVDVVIQAHDHNYERSYPVYQNETISTSYEDPTAPVYFVVGMGGVDKNDHWLDPLPSWNANFNDKFGCLLMQAPDEYTLEMQYISKSYTIEDTCTITRTSTFW